jgi:Domain of unknown function (DUF4280)
MGQQVVNLGLCQCTMGQAPTPLKVLPMNKVTSTNMPAATIMDNKPFVNITPFGICKSPNHPLFKPCKGKPPCLPSTSAPWVPGSPTVMIGSAGPALNNMSKLICSYGGMIQITMPGQFTQMIP